MNKKLGLMTEKALLEAVECAKTTLNVYLCRAEFAHIQKVRMEKNKFLFKGVTNKDIRRLKELKKRNKGILYY